MPHLPPAPGRCGIGIQVEACVRNVAALVARSVSRDYLGLHDPMMDRGHGSLSLALADGSADTRAGAPVGAGIPRPPGRAAPPAALR